MSTRSTARTDICKLLANASRPLSRCEIATAIGAHRDSIKVHIRHMIADGEIRNVSSNHLKSAYVMPDEVAQAYRPATTPSRVFVNATQTKPLTTTWGPIRAGAEIAFELPSGGTA